MRNTCDLSQNTLHDVVLVEGCGWSREPVQHSEWLTCRRSSDGYTERFRRSSRDALLFFALQNTMAPSVPRSRQVGRVLLLTTNGVMNVSSRKQLQISATPPTTESPGNGADTELRESLSRETIGRPQGVSGGKGQNPDHSSAKARDRHPDATRGLTKINNSDNAQESE